MFNEFKKFAMRGNVIDMAVGIVVGAAFGTIVKSFVDDILMPPLGLLAGRVDFSNVYLVLKQGTVSGPYATLVQAQEAGAVTMNIGLFANAIISFLIIAWAVFMVVKAMNKMQKKETEKPAELAATPKEQVLLEEIRDILKNKNS